MAAGKSSLAQALAEHLPRSVHLRGDLFRRMVVRGRAEPAPQMTGEASAQLNLRYRIAASVARQYADAGFTVVYQDVILEADLNEVVHLLRPHDLRVVVLCPDPDVVARRDAARGKTGYGGEWTVGELAASLDRTPRLGLWLDNSALSLDETVQVILDKLNEAQV